MYELLFYPILVLLLIIQTTIVRQLPLVSGSADLMLIWLAAWGVQDKGKHVWIGAIFTALIVSFVSAIPWYAILFSYLFVAFFSRFMNRHYWHNRLIAIFLIVFICSLIEYLAQFASLKLNGITINFLTSFTNIIVPSVFLNLLLVLPIYALVNDMARWIYPAEADNAS